jgi:tRNA dimethylallyltransferase
MIPYAFGDILHHFQQFIETNPTGVLFLRWTTATGKSAIACELASILPLEIISSDSRQIFRGMDIGTDKVSAEIRARIPHHQIDIVNPDQQYTAWERAFDTKNIIQTLHQSKKFPLIVWWTGLYIDTIYKNFRMPEVEPNEELRKELYKKEEETPGVLHTLLREVDPESAHTIHPRSIRYIIRALEIYYATGKPKSQIATVSWPTNPTFLCGLWRDVWDNDQRIHQRIVKMLENWLMDEVQKLLNAWYTLDLQSMQGIGYKECVAYLCKEISYDEVIASMSFRTRTYAKRQRTRLRRYIADATTNPFPNVTYRTYQL